MLIHDIKNKFLTECPRSPIFWVYYKYIQMDKTSWPFSMSVLASKGELSAEVLPGHPVHLFYLTQISENLPKIFQKIWNLSKVFQKNLLEKFQKLENASLRSTAKYHLKYIYYVNCLFMASVLTVCQVPETFGDFFWNVVKSEIRSQFDRKSKQG